MKTLMFATALLLGGAAVAQTYESTTITTDPVTEETTTTTTTTDPVTDTSTTTTTTTDAAAPMPMPVTTAALQPASPAVIQPSNANPERDARGITVISAEAHVPSGWNGIGGAMGGPVEAGDDASYPPCTAEVTDNCLQTYERGRSD